MKNKFLMITFSALVMGLCSCEGFLNTSPNTSNEGANQEIKENENETNDVNNGGKENNNEGDKENENNSQDEQKETNQNNDQEISNDSIALYDFSTSAINKSAHLSDGSQSTIFINEFNAAAKTENFVTSIVADNVDMNEKVLLEGTKKVLKIGSSKNSGSLNIIFSTSIKKIEISAQLYFNRYSSGSTSQLHIDDEAALLVNQDKRVLPLSTIETIENETEILVYEKEYETSVDSISIANEGGRVFLNYIKVTF